MRVISGERKGTRLKAVPGSTTRPTADKVKESLFNIIGPYFAGGDALDLYAGSGGLGIEALSRGCDRAVFVDRHGKAIQTIQDNLRATRYEAQATVQRQDARAVLDQLAETGRSFKLIFMDPPYHEEEHESFLQLIESNRLLTDNGVVVCEHGSETTLPGRVGLLEKIKVQRYSSVITISLYEYATTEE
ncbi:MULTISPECIES: 16S rRNA (guanine(966)-N(2))-methyltransferase RsmD [unclassified Exiguobacterium]|uniref:16S rRNA (guanine(966)-N(2))-methyltransferase RsmD n=1 Tax=unclassified Exiguobacterium TaxID=2644629 RepID=UPI00103A758D|nr:MULTISPECIES: 16S rRNA (guanine(966)-N(2))-methyltransferase RsmD [unclassified Exiguobacterium]TCI71984.1 16S rRNA (guanine(966)-N(2))-methyltransferase RsmD [Exiguobacterium sp. SH0S7]